jgi:tRNA(Ile)-lysidine synthase
VDPLLEHLRKAILRGNLAQPGHRVAIAVSGGADSTALLHLMAKLAPDLGLTLAVAHVNHQLRGADSDADAAFVQQLAVDYRLPFHLHVERPPENENIEQAARRIRLVFFAGLIEQGLVDRVATAHTRDDQAETVLFRILRGAALPGLAGILPITREGLIRPLLDASRESLRASLNGRPYREDASNQEDAYARNRIRNHLLPQLERDWNPLLSQALARMAGIARDEDAYLEAETMRVAEGILAPRDAAVILYLPALRQQPVALQRRLIRRAFAHLKGDLLRVESSHVEAVLTLMDSRLGDGRLQVPGVDVFRSFDWIRLSPLPAPLRDRNWSMSIPCPGDYTFPDGRFTLLRANPGTPGYNEATEVLDWSLAAPPLVLRNWRPGDAYLRAGQSRHTLEKVKDLFQIFRIPLWERRDWPILTQGDQIVWVHRFGPAAGRQAVPASVEWLCLRVAA